ncbi:MAG TPA: hypothetical protein VGD56_15760, partial [Gemmatirosa sp.]
SALTLAASALLLAVPAGLALALVWALRRAGGAALGPWLAVPGAALFTLAAAGVLWPVIGWLGRVFERTDPVETTA